MSIVLIKTKYMYSDSNANVQAASTERGEKGAKTAANIQK